MVDFVVEEVAEGDDADDLVVLILDGEVADVVFGHDADGVVEIGVSGQDDDVLGHDGVECGGGGIEAGFDDAGHEVAFGENAFEEPGVVEDENGTSVGFGHLFDGGHDGVGAAHFNERPVVGQEAGE